MPKATLEEPCDLLTTEEVTELLFAGTTPERAASTCVLPAIRQGGRWRFRKSDLEDWIKQQAQVPRMATS
jgi:excisionase family DNA binding protein